MNWVTKYQLDKDSIAKKQVDGCVDASNRVLLQPENLEIVRNTLPVLWIYQDFTNAYALQNQLPECPLNEFASRCQHDGDYKMLTQKVFVNQEAHLLAEKKRGSRVKLFCTVYTIEANHDRFQPILQTCECRRAPFSPQPRFIMSCFGESCSPRPHPHPQRHN